MFDPRQWYWLADDGRVFSSARQAVVSTSDSAYVAWREAGLFPTAWPKDDGGAQTTAALQSVLTPYGLFADLKAYAAAARFARETGGITVGNVPIATDDRSKTMILGARVAAEADTNFTTPWVGSDGAITVLNATQVIAIANAVLAHVSACFSTFATVVSEIAAGSVTTTAEIDEAFAAIGV